MIIRAINGEEVIIDRIDADLMQYNWSVNKGGCVVRYIKKENGKYDAILIGREILERILGRELLSGHKEEVDHKDLNKLNNKRSNLRLASRSQNSVNKKKVGETWRGKCSSQYKGVSWHTKRQVWQAKMQINGKAVWLGYYNDEIAAARAYDKEMLKHFGEFAQLNNA
jgi:hypothetical protein